MGYFDEDESNDEAPLEDEVPSVPDSVPASEPEAETSGSEDSGVVWVRGENGKLERS